MQDNLTIGRIVFAPEFNFNRRKFMSGVCAATAIAAVPAISGCTVPSWINTAENDLPTIENIAASILSIVALGNPALTPAILAGIQLGVSGVQAGLKTVEALIADYKVAPGTSVIIKIDAALTDVQTNLSAILAAAHIDDAALQATISAGVSLAILVVQGIQALVPAASASNMMTSLSGKGQHVQRVQVKAQMKVPVKIPTSAEIKAYYNLVATASGYAAQQI